MNKSMLAMISVLVLTFGVSSVGLTQTWYVDGDISSSGDGVSWGQAFQSIQEAVDAADVNHEIWVKQGTYWLSSQINVNKTVSIFGGFDGTETLRDQRDWKTNVTTVDGQDGRRCFYVTADATMNGLTVTHGREEDASGGGIYILGCSPTITNCVITQNTSLISGGGIYCEGSPPATISNCMIIRNTTSYGGGILNISSSPTITNCTISNNTANPGRGIYNHDSSPTITNCILWGGTNQIDNYGSSSPTVTYSDIYIFVEEIIYPGEGNMNHDPLYVDSPNHDFHLQDVSPCREAGDNSAAVLLATDFEGDPRLYDADDNGTATVDMGADEWLPPPDIDVSPLSHDFGDIAVGSASGPVDIIISNNGETDLTVSDISLSDDTNYGLAGDTTATIAPESSHTVTVTFSPVSPWPLDATLTIISDDPDSPSVLVLLLGEGVPVPEPDISVSPIRHLFGEVLLGVSSTAIVTIENVGDADLTVSGIELWEFSDPDYVITSEHVLPTVLPPVASVDVEITFTPLTAGELIGTLDITSDDPDEPLVQVQLSGTGKPPVCQCDFLPDDPAPIEIPRGDPLGFRASVTNNTARGGQVSFATRVTNPDATMTGWIIRPRKVDLGPRQTKSKHVSHTIPPTATLGNYVYHGYVGTHGLGIIDECQFEFKVIEEAP